MSEKNLINNSSKAKEYFLEKISFEKSPEELKEWISKDIKDINIIDVRAYDDYIDGHIPFAIHVPFDSLEEHLMMLEKNLINIVYGYCPYCLLAQKAAYIIAQKGYPVCILKGGYNIWTQKGFDTVKNSSNDKM